MATPASGDAAQMFSHPPSPIAEIWSADGQTGQGGRARLEGASRGGGEVASGPPNPSSIK
eukprot:6208729-Pleurochrysis_carterae.AAC.1